MSSQLRTFHIGLRIKPDTTGFTLTREGETKISSSLIQVYLDSAIRTLVTTDQSQTLTNKTIVAASNTITTAASGNLVATEINAALSELQGDIDTRALSSDLTTHISDTTTHGTTGDIVGTSDSQTLTNKTIVAASNTITTAASGNLVATELNAALAELQGDIDTRLTSGALTSHEGDTSTHGVTEIVGTSETQTLTNKTIVAANNTITTAASGNLVATSLNAALAELQGDIDTRALSSDLTTHMSDTTTHGTTGDIVGTSDTQVITNKDIDGGTAANTRRITLPKDTKANLDALTRKEGTIWFASDEDKAYVDNGSALVAIGSGGTGSPDTIFEINADNYTSLSGWSTGDGTIVDGSALPGGTLQGTFELITSSPAEGTKHFRFTQAAGSLDTYFLSDAQTIAEVWRGKDVGCNVSLKYDGSDNDLYIIVWDATNNRRLTTTDFYVKASTTYRNHQMVFTIPSTCTSIRVGFQVRALNSGKIINFDKFSLFDRPFVMANVNDVQHKTISQAQSSMTDRTAGIRFNLSTVTNEVNSNDNTLFVIEDDSTNSRTRVRLLRAAQVRIAVSSPDFTGSLSYFIINKIPISTGSNLQLQMGSETSTTRRSSGISTVDYGQPGDTYWIQAAGSDLFSSTEICRLSVQAQSQNESVITPASPSLVYSALIANNGTASITNQGPQDWISSVSRTALGRVTITFTSGFFSVEPNVTVTAWHTNGYIMGTESGSASSIVVSCLDDVGTSVDKTFMIVATRAGNDAKSASRALVATPVDRVCYFKDSKAANSDGGTFTSGSYQTRTINTISGDTSFCSLSSNQLTLQAGTYQIMCRAPFYKVDKNKLKLYNVTDATDTIIGDLAYSGIGIDASGNATLAGQFTITAQKTFEVRHRCFSTFATYGFGHGSSGSFGDEEIFTSGWIKKIK